MYSVYKYDKFNCIIGQVCPNLNWACTYKYNNGFRKIYYYHFKVKTWQIVKEIMVNLKYEPLSSLTIFNGSAHYVSFKNGKTSYQKTWFKSKVNKFKTFEVKNLIQVGDSSIEELNFMNKDGKKEKHLRIKTKQNGRNDQQQTN